jgi:hypothetical protein
MKRVRRVGDGAPRLLPPVGPEEHFRLREGVRGTTRPGRRLQMPGRRSWRQTPPYPSRKRMSSTGLRSVSTALTGPYMGSGERARRGPVMGIDCSATSPRKPRCRGAVSSGRVGMSS